MKEDKVKVAIMELQVLRDAVVPATGKTHLDGPITLLKEAIAPEQPEIPEGCPVLAWNDGDEHEKIRTFLYNTGYDCGEVYYRCGSPDDYTAYNSIEIDYQRKGHVIPWHGGVKSPVNNPDDIIIPIVRDRPNLGRRRAGFHIWDEETVAYVIVPEWVKS